MDQVNEVLKQATPTRQSFFQLNFFVLGKEPTIQAKLRRCIDEMNMRRSSVEAMEMEIEELTDKAEIDAKAIKRLEEGSGDFGFDKSPDPINIRRSKRKLSATYKQIEKLKKDCLSTKEELNFFLQAFKKYEKVQPLKNWDDLEVQLEYWNAKLQHEVQAKTILQQPITVDVLTTILSLPDIAPIKKQIVELIDKQQKRLNSKEEDHASS